MKRMFLMTLVLSVMAMGSAMANDGSVNRGPKKSKVVIVVKPGEIAHNIFCGGPHHDCNKRAPYYNDCRHDKRSCDWSKNRPEKRPNRKPHGNNHPPKWDGRHGKDHKPGPGYGRK